MPGVRRWIGVVMHGLKPRGCAKILGAVACIWLGGASGASASHQCTVLPPGPGQVVRPGDVVTVDQFMSVGGDRIGWLGVIARPPFLQPGGHLVVPPGSARVFHYNQIARPGRPGLYWLKVAAISRLLTDGSVASCVVIVTPIRLLPPLCKAPPVCEVSEAGPIEATVGGEPVEFTVCVEAGCEDAHAALTLENLPGFLGLQGESRDAQGRCCYTFRIYPCSDDAGTYTATFKAKNTDGGAAEGECSVDIVILDAEE